MLRTGARPGSKTPNTFWTTGLRFRSQSSHPSEGTTTSPSNYSSARRSHSRHTVSIPTGATGFTHFKGISSITSQCLWVLSLWTNPFEPSVMTFAGAVFFTTHKELAARQVARYALQRIEEWLSAPPRCECRKGRAFEPITWPMFSQQRVCALWWSPEARQCGPRPCQSSRSEIASR